MPLDCRLIIDEPADGAWNMAVDEALFESAAEGGPATLRLYRWAEPTLSLGYFQSYEDRGGHATSTTLPCVRRSSGGGALVHDRELTYSLTLPPGALPGRDTRDLYCDAHRAVIDTVRDLGGEADRLVLCDPAAEKLAPSEEPFLCFLRRADGDLLVTGPPPSAVTAPGRGENYKVAGSAQRKKHGALLQHGGVLLAESTHAPELPGLAELGVLGASTAAVVDSLQCQLANRLGLCLTPSELTRPERQRSEDLRETKHSTSQWLKRR